MKFSLQIPRNMLRAVARFAAKQDIRYYLNGVYVEVHANVAYVVATDGHTMAVGRIARNIDPKRGDTLMEGQGAAIIPSDALKVKANGLDVVLKVDGDSFTFTDVEAAGAITAKCVEGRFPDWRRVVPSTVTGEPGQYNPEYLKRCQDAVADIRGNKNGAFIGVGYNGANGAAIVHLSAYVLAVVMPLREDAPTKAPDWTAEDPASFGRVVDVDKAHTLALADGDILCACSAEECELKAAA